MDIFNKIRLHLQLHFSVNRFRDLPVQKFRRTQIVLISEQGSAVSEVSEASEKAKLTVQF